MKALELAAILRVNAVDPDKDLPLAECVKRFMAAPVGAQETWAKKAWGYLLEAAEPPGLTCGFDVNPFADPDDPEGVCHKPALLVTFRRKGDGLIQHNPRCYKHRFETNEKWAAVGAPIFRKIHKVEDFFEHDGKTVMVVSREYEGEGAWRLYVVPEHGGPVEIVVEREF